ncbi:MAG: hypothetical protein WBF89_09770 [Steroidobacteraceae bacterium]
MENLKSFDSADIDETLTRVVAHGKGRHLLFPYIDATSSVPKFNSIGRMIAGASATIEDFAALTAQVRQAAKQARWFISFNTPWLVAASEVQEILQRPSIPRGKRR